MINIILCVALILGFAYAIYDQFLIDRLKGNTLLAVELKPQAKIDTLIFAGLILLTTVQGIQTGISSFTLFLLVLCIALALYLGFFRSPYLRFKQHGFFFSQFYIPYQHIQQLNLAPQQKFVVDLSNGKRLVIPIKHEKDIAPVVDFFGGYKS